MRSKNIIIKLCINILLINVIGLLINVKIVNALENDYIPKYKTYGHDLSEEELEEYYQNNNFEICSTTSKQRKELSNPIEALNSVYPGYSNWTVTSRNDVSCKSLGVPSEADSDQAYVVAAKQASSINNDDPIGCGPLAILTQFTYLATCLGYYSLGPNIEYPMGINEAGKYVFYDDELPYNRELAIEIFNNTYTLLVQNGEQKMTLPINFVSACNKILYNHNLSVKDSDGNYTDQAIYINADLTPNILEFSTKVNNIKDSIDNGMPVVWWTMDSNNLGDYAGHYMTIYGYEYYQGTNDAGDKVNHLMFLIRMNWGRSGVRYLDSDLLKVGLSGFIFFEEKYTKTYIKPEDFNLPCQYNNTEISKTLVPTLGESIQIKYLRAGYVDKYDSTNTVKIGSELSLSANKTGFGEAYIHFRPDTEIRYIFIELAYWSANEGVTSLDIMAPYEDDQWESVYNFITEMDGGMSNNKENKKIAYKYFPTLLGNIRIKVKSDNPTSTRNKGRVVIGKILILQS